MFPDGSGRTRAQSDDIATTALHLAGVGTSPTSTAMARILTYSSPATGHAPPLVGGLSALAARGHDVHVRSGTTHLDTFAAAGLSASEQDPRLAALGSTDHAPKKPVERLRCELTDLLTRGSLERIDLLDAIDSFSPDVLIVDADAYGALTVAEASGLPWAMSTPPRDDRPAPFAAGLTPQRSRFGRPRADLAWRADAPKYAGAMLPGLNVLRHESRLPALARPEALYDAPDRVLTLRDPLGDLAELIPLAAGRMGVRSAAGIRARTTADIAAEAARDAVRAAARDHAMVVA